MGYGRFDELLGLVDAEVSVGLIPPLSSLEPVEVWVCPVLQYQELRNGSVDLECLLLRAVDGNSRATGGGSGSGSGSASGSDGGGETGGERTFVRCGTARISNRWFKGWKLEGITII